MFNVRLAGGHMNGKQLFTWLSLVVSLMASFVLSFFPLDVLDEIWDLTESVSEGFLTFSLIPPNISTLVPPNTKLAGPRCKNDVVLSSMRRHHVASTLIRRQFGPIWPRGIDCV